MAKTDPEGYRLVQQALREDLPRTFRRAFAELKEMPAGPDREECETVFGWLGLNVTDPEVGALSDAELMDRICKNLPEAEKKIAAWEVVPTKAK